MAWERDRSRRGELQRLLGEAGTVLPRQMRGTVDRPAQGWYAQVKDGPVVFLGDHLGLAAARIQRMLGE